MHDEILYPVILQNSLNSSCALGSFVNKINASPFAMDLSALLALRTGNGHFNPRKSNSRIKTHFKENWLGRLGSNQGSRDQNPLPYRLATPQTNYFRIDRETLPHKL